MVRLPARILAAVAVGALVAITAGACSSGDPIAKYIADERAVLPAADNAGVDDSSLIFAGQIICQSRAEAEANPAGYGYPKVAEVALANCDALAAVGPPPGEGVPDGEAGLGGEANANELTDRGAQAGQVGEASSSSDRRWRRRSVST